MHEQPLIKPVWLKVLIFLTTLLFINLLTVWILRAIFNALAASLPHVENIGDSDIQTGITGSLIASVATVLFFCRFIDKNTFGSLGFNLKHNLRHAGTGFFLSLFLLGSGTLLLALNGNLRWDDIHVDALQLLVWLGLMTAVALSEELAFRGYLLGNLLQSATRWQALFISSVIFVIFHGFNPGASLLAFINIFFAGCLLGINYIYTKNCWFGFMFHLGWNFYQGAVLGFKVSGLKIPSLLEQQLTGNGLLTGGKFGFEGSMLYTLLSFISITLLVWVYENRYR